MTDAALQRLAALAYAAHAAALAQACQSCAAPPPFTALAPEQQCAWAATVRTLLVARTRLDLRDDPDRLARMAALVYSLDLPEARPAVPAVPAFSALTLAEQQAWRGAVQVVLQAAHGSGGAPPDEEMP